MLIFIIIIIMYLHFIIYYYYYFIILFKSNYKINTIKICNKKYLKTHFICQEQIKPGIVLED